MQVVFRRGGVELPVPADRSASDVPEGLRPTVPTRARPVALDL
ncbi:hypothetical protein ACQPZF_36805 [Actinosynnema sp. CS-041913]